MSQFGVVSDFSRNQLCTTIFCSVYSVLSLESSWYVRNCSYYYESRKLDPKCRLGSLYSRFIGVR